MNRALSVRQCRRWHLGGLVGYVLNCCPLSNITAATEHVWQAGGGVASNPRAHMRKKAWSSILWFLIVIIACPVARATVLQRLFLDDMVEKSAVVIHATVLSSRAEWNASRSSIWTVYTVRAHRYLKGFLGETFEFREPGGTVGNVGMYVAGPVMRARACLVLSLLVLVALRSVPGSAYTQSTTSEGFRLRWASGAVIRYTFNENFAPNNNNARVRGAVGDALRTLEAATPRNGGTPALSFEDGGTTALNKTGLDCVNLITFTAPDPDDQLPDGVLAQARTFFFLGDGQAQCGDQIIQVTAGEIVDADMLYNTTKALSTSLVQEDVFDIQGLALHEGGHWLGLNHTGIVAAVMSPFGEGGEAPVRRLLSDDLAGLQAIYGASGGSISGRVTTGNSVEVSVVAGSDSQSTPVTLQLGSSAPRIFMVPNTDQGAILNGFRNNVLVDAANPAQAGDVITIFGTGLGAVTNPPASGVAASGNPLSTTTLPPNVTIGGQAAAVPFSGLAPFFVGLYQVNATVPGGLTPGRVPVVIGTSAGSSNQAVISV